MPSRLSPLDRPLLGVSAVLIVAFFGGIASGQDELPGNSESAIEAAYSAKTGRGQLQKLLRGDEIFDANNKAHTEALDIGARYVTYRFTWNSIEQKTSGIDGVHSDFETAHLKLILGNKQDQQAIAKAYTKAVIVRAREVIALRSNNGRKPDIARLNAARVLAKLADLGQGELADALLDVFKQELARDSNPGGPKRNDGVVYYMLHGLRELLTPPPLTPPQPPPIPAKLTPEQQKTIAETLTAFIAKAPEFSKDTPAEEIEGYRVLRREAVRALAYCRPTEGKDAERPGMTLLRIMARDGFTPEPGVDECLEAALGVARMRADIDGKDFQADYAAHMLGEFVDWFAQYYLDKKDKEPRPYKTYATRLSDALETMKAETKDPYVGKVVDEARKVLFPIEKGERLTTVSFSTWLENNPPGKEGLFQGVAESKVKPPNRRSN
jgi:hypothetical protein